jgi:hypothetical protein
MGLRWLTDDLASSIRRIRRHPRSFVYPVLMLAVGIGSTVGIFDVAYEGLHRALPYRHADQIAVAGSDLGTRLYSGYDFQPNPSLQTIFEKSAAYETASANLDTGSGPQRIQIARVTPQFFSTLGVELLGPGFSTSIPPSPAPKVAWLPIVISDRLRRTYFASEKGILNRSLELDISPNHFEVVGIAPPGVSFPPRVDAWLPPGFQGGSVFQSPDLPGSFGTIGLLRSGLSTASAEARVRAWPLPSWYMPQPDAKTARLISLPDFLGGELHHLGLVLWLATIFFLVLTIMAAMGIFQIELEERRQEFSIRSMLGANPLRLYASFSLGIGFALLAALIASFLVRYALIRVTATYLSLPRGLHASVDGIGLAMALGAVGIVFIATVMGQATGLGPNPRPTFSISRMLGSKPVKSATKPHTVSRPSFPVQITLAAVILITATLLARSAYNLMHIDPGLQPQNAFICEIALPSSFGKSILKPPDPKLPPEERKKAIEAIFKKRHQLLNAHFALILQRLGTNLSVVSDGVISVAPYRGYPGEDMDSYYSRTPWVPQRGQPPPANIVHHTLARTMSPGAIPALGMRLIYGSNFSPDGSDQPTVIVNQALAEHLGPGSSALGQYLQIYGLQIQGFPAGRIIGIAKNVHEKDLYSLPQPTVYYPLNEWAQTTVDMVVRTSGNISGQDILGVIQASVQAIAPEATVSNFASLSERVQSAGELTRYCAYYLLALAWLSVFLAAICAWSRSICEIHRRKQEIGIRMALGGTPGNIVRLVLIRGLAVTVIAALAGVLVAWWFSHLLSYLFYGVKSADPVSYLIGVTTVIGFVFTVQSLSINNAVKCNPSDLMRAGLEIGDSSPKS